MNVTRGSGNPEVREAIYSCSLKIWQDNVETLRDVGEIK